MKKLPITRKAKQKINLIVPDNHRRYALSSLYGIVNNFDGDVVFEDKVFKDLKLKYFGSMVVVRWDKKQNMIFDIWNYEE